MIRAAQYTSVQTPRRIPREADAVKTVTFKTFFIAFMNFIVPYTPVIFFASGFTGRSDRCSPREIFCQGEKL